ncbi:hypothetical protein O6072_08955 [Mycolicibacterium neoaurum]|uniref:hypothetical protein n=1 Tax=Mycolicibacterium neoaurum TaxID=1795 RepID=UPI00248D08F7|nr:hypothetical protein [Mycolicibacterium neoaurum]WBP96508.1 hypothetical protein O7W24_10230 [Mycolicibacterium neoaurum]WBS09961.1 hypothetical protein O6072_08955 [Mycolicibacterium neoaurum]
MSESLQAPAETHANTSPVATAAPARSRASTRIYRVAAGVGIAVGGVIIAGAIFMFGLLIGSQSSTGWDDPGYTGIGYEADWHMGMFDGDDAAFWGEWNEPGDAEPSSPNNTQPAPAR